MGKQLYQINPTTGLLDPLFTLDMLDEVLEKIEKEFPNSLDLPESTPYRLLLMLTELENDKDNFVIAYSILNGLYLDIFYIDEIISFLEEANNEITIDRLREFLETYSSDTQLDYKIQKLARYLKDNNLVERSTVYKSGGECYLQDFEHSEYFPYIVSDSNDEAIKSGSIPFNSNTMKSKFMMVPAFKDFDGLDELHYFDGKYFRSISTAESFNKSLKEGEEHLFINVLDYVIYERLSGTSSPTQNSDEFMPANYLLSGTYYKKVGNEYIPILMPNASEYNTLLYRMERTDNLIDNPPYVEGAIYYYGTSEGGHAVGDPIQPEIGSSGFYEKIYNENRSESNPSEYIYEEIDWDSLVTSEIPFYIRKKESISPVDYYNGVAVTEDESIDFGNIFSKVSDFISNEEKKLQDSALKNLIHGLDVKIGDSFVNGENLTLNEEYSKLLFFTGPEIKNPTDYFDYLLTPVVDLGTRNTETDPIAFRNFRAAEEFYEKALHEFLISDGGANDLTKSGGIVKINKEICDKLFGKTPISFSSQSEIEFGNEDEGTVGDFNAANYLAMDNWYNELANGKMNTAYFLSKALTKSEFSPFSEENNYIKLILEKRLNQLSQTSISQNVLRFIADLAEYMGKSYTLNENDPKNFFNLDKVGIPLRDFIAAKLNEFAYNKDKIITNLADFRYLVFFIYIVRDLLQVKDSDSSKDYFVFRTFKSEVFPDITAGENSVDILMRRVYNQMTEFEAIRKNIEKFEAKLIETGKFKKYRG